jgi:hypothetical protein
MSSYNAIEFFDRGFGPRMVPVTPPEGDISPSSKLHPKSMGKAPGVLTQSGWTSLDVNNVKFRCHDYATAKLWCEDWGANTGFAAGDGYVVFDNDEGREFSLVLRGLLSNAPRRFVQDPKHERDAFFVRVLDFVGDGATVANAELTFRNGVRVAKLSILARGKQSVIGGVHPGTRSPYVWDRDITDIADIPAMTEEMFDVTVRKFIKELNSRGWKLDGPAPRPVSGVSAAQPASKPAAIATGHPTPSQSGGSPRFAHARALLSLIPNRDIPPNITPSPADIWLDDYVNWTDVGYLLAAFLEGDVLDPEAEEVFCEWSDGRAQIKQSSLALWRGIRGQALRYQSSALEKRVHELIQGEPDFPDDIDPNDPSMQVNPPAPPLWPVMRERWVFCASQGGGFIDMDDKKPISKTAFSDAHLTIARVLKREIMPRAQKPPSVATMFLSRPDHIEVHNITYSPGKPRLIHVPHLSLPLANFWRPTSVKPAAVTDLQVKPWLDHLTFVLGSVVERDRFLCWSAFVVQHPDRKPQWHWLVISDQGVGKDSMLKPLKLAVGTDNWYENLSDGLKGDFNYMMERKLLIIGETGQTRFASAHDISTKLKPLAAAPPDEITINKKNLHPYLIPNVHAVILFSNEEHPLHLEQNQRRFHVVNRRQKEKPQSEAYYAQLHGWFAKGGAELSASYLLNYPLTDADHGNLLGGVAPSSDDKTELEQLSLPPQQIALNALIEDARDGIQDGTPFKLIATAQELSQMIRDQGQRPPTFQQVSQWLLSMERENRGVRRYKIDPKKPNHCDVVNTTVNGSIYSGRLWLLANKTADGRDWNSLTTAEIIAIWKNLTIKNASVTPFPSKAKGAFPDDEDVV